MTEEDNRIPELPDLVDFTLRLPPGVINALHEMGKRLEVSVEEICQVAITQSIVDEWHHLFRDLADIGSEIGNGSHH